MLETVITSPKHLQRHLHAPLLKERETFLLEMKRRGVSRDPIHTAAAFLLNIVEYLDLQDGDKAPVTIEAIVDAANRWNAAVGPAKRKRHFTSWPRFVNLAMTWLGKIGRLDPRLSESSIFCRLFSPGRRRMLYVTAPMLKERQGYLEEYERRGGKRITLRRIAKYQLHLIDRLHLGSGSKVSMAEVDAAAKEWICVPKDDSRHSTGGTSAWRDFAYIAHGWLRSMGVLSSEEERLDDGEKIDQYLSWLVDRRGFSEWTRKSRRSLLRRFIRHLNGQGRRLSRLTAKDVDEYLEHRGASDGCCRRTLAGTVSVIRGFLLHAAQNGWCDTGLPQLLTAPRVYKDEDIPAFASWDTVTSILQKSQVDESPVGIRNHAILTLLATYGMRSSELTGLRLCDFDWRNETLYIRRAKNCRPQSFPLARTAGDAVIRYIREVRPNWTGMRELFVSARAPYRPITHGVVYPIVRHALDGEHATPRHRGPHCLRHSCATHLVNSGHSFKEVADMLGHMHVETTRTYAKVDMPSLRSVSDMDWEGLV